MPQKILPENPQDLLAEKSQQFSVPTKHTDDLSNASNLSSLLDILTIDRSMELDFQQSYKMVIPTVLKRSLHPEIQLVVCSVMILGEVGRVANKEVGALLHTNLSFPEMLEAQLGQLEITIEDPVASLKAIVATQEVVNYFTWSFERRLCRSPNSTVQCPGDVENKLSASEIHRVQRALWRFELCSALYTSWMPSSPPPCTLLSKVYDCHWASHDGHVKRLMNFLDGFNPWEIEELHCIYDHLENMLRRDPKDPRLDHLGRIVDPGIVQIPKPSLSLTNSRILAHGLQSLHYYITSVPPSARIQMEEKSVKHPDKFILAALNELKQFEERFDTNYERAISCRNGPWNDLHSPQMANWAWKLFSPIPHGTLPTFAYLRHFGFCIWDQARMDSWKKRCPHEEYWTIHEVRCGQEKLSITIPPPRNLARKSFTVTHKTSRHDSPPTSPEKAPRSITQPLVKNPYAHVLVG